MKCYHVMLTVLVYRVFVDGQPDTKKEKVSVDDLLGLPYD
jgi:hypothetical protein